MIEYSMFLNKAIDEYFDGEIKNLFDFPYDMPDCYKPIFQYKFFLHYRFHNINYDSPFMFKSYLESALLELMPKYKKLYESENMVTNPFVNYMLGSDTYNRNRGQNKGYDTNRGEHFSEDESGSGSVNVNRTGVSDIGTKSGVNSGHENTTNKSTGDKKSVTDNQYTDTPQSEQKTVEGDVSFNDGFITTRDLDTVREAEISSTANDKTNKDFNQESHHNNNYSQSYGDSITQNQGIHKARDYTDSYRVNALEETTKNIKQIYGLSGESVSKILLEWRTTFINIDKMLIEDLRHLFMYVY